MGRFEGFVISGDDAINIFHTDIELARNVGGFAGAAINEDANGNENGGGKKAAKKDLEDETAADFGLLDLLDRAIRLRDLLEILKIIHMVIL